MTLAIQDRISKTAEFLQPKVQIEPLVADGCHNAFASFVKWRGRYWLAYRRASGHTARDGEIVVLFSADTKEWTEVIRFDLGGDDRDPQFMVFGDRLWLYINRLWDGVFKIFATCSGDGQVWDPPQQIYCDGFILWKPVLYQGRLYAGVHKPGSDDQRLSQLMTSSNGISWAMISSIRRGTGESETALVFDQAGNITAFLRDQTRVGGAILEARPPFVEWTQRPAGVHLSGHAVYTFSHRTYVLSRGMACEPQVAAEAPRDALPAELDQGTVIYTYEDGALEPYCLLGPLSGNHDSSYATAVQEGDEMIVVFHRSVHEYTGKYCYRDAADLFLARVLLKN